MSSGGVVSGTPTTAETCTFTARVVDAGATAQTQEYSALMTMPVQESAAINSVQAGTVNAVVTYGSPGLPVGVVCTVTATDVVTGGTAGQSVDAGGAATRTIVVENLTAGTAYFATVTCGGGPSPSVPFTTQAESVATAGVVVSLKPPGSLGEVIGKLKVEYGPAFASSVTDDAADGSGRYSVTIPAQTVGSIVQYRWQWLTATDVAVTGVSKTRFAVVK